ncbi:MAG: TRAP transporter small permease [Ignavibacteriales bacterium]|nr:TRAP transporter small permease [Ignavibacteriales bacterium]
MVLLAFAQVILRNVFGTGLVWGDTIVRHMVLWAGFVGGALASYEGRHISIDALTKFFPPRVKHGAAGRDAPVRRGGLLLPGVGFVDIPDGGDGGGRGIRSRASRFGPPWPSSPRGM